MILVYDSCLADTVQKEGNYLQALALQTPTPDMMFSCYRLWESLLQNDEFFFQQL